MQIYKYTKPNLFHQIIADLSSTSCLIWSSYNVKNVSYVLKFAVKFMIMMIILYLSPRGKFVFGTLLKLRNKITYSSHVIHAKIQNGEYNTSWLKINVKLLKQKAVKYFYLVIGQPLSFALRIESMQEGRNKQAF